MKNIRKMLVIDGNSILNRAYYGIRPLTNKNGLYTHAVYGMINIISRQVDSVRPDYCVVAFDLKAPTFRHKMYDGYKANRKGMPEELAVQLPYAKECMKALGYRVLTCEGYEADDILGTLSRSAAEAGVHAYILTGDRDSLQLINDNVSVLLVKTKETLEYTEGVFFDNYGVTPDVFVDVKALMGDSSDNIPGVAGIGEKTALKLIADYGNMDALYEKLAELPLSASVKQKLTAGKDMAYLSKALATIDTNAPVDTSLDASEYKGADKKALYSLFTELEFFAFIKRFGLEGMGSAEDTCALSKADNGDKAEEKAEEISEGIAEYFFGKTVALCLGDGAVYISDGKKYASISESDGAVFSLLANIRIVCHDYKEIYKHFSAAGIKIGECEFDTMLAAYVLNSGRSKYLFDDVASVYLGTAETKGNAAQRVFALYVALSKEIEIEKAHELLYGIEIPLAKVLADMELAGFRIDVAGIERYGCELMQMAQELKERVYSQAGEEFNINSPKQLGEVLFEKMGLPAPKKTKTGYATDAETLGKLASKYNIIADILEYRHVTKLKSTYAEGLVKAADAEGRIHSLFNQTGTATGRLSSAEPNLQNIPVKTEMGKRFRKYFIPKNDDYVIIDADYSQIELRLLAHISGDENMKNAFLNGEDIHTATAATVFGVSAEQVTPELRKRAKAVNFGIVYGIGEHSLSEDLGISRNEAKLYIESYLAGYPKVSEYLDGIKIKAREDGYVTTEFGRRRYIPELSASNKNVQKFGERVAMNSPIQGTAADIIKIAMIRVADRLREADVDATLILQVHDELLIECRRTQAEDVKKILVDCMEGAADFSVPLDVEANIGDTWYDAK
ncbi:MAG: DNA polymerase I [Ruminococcaceae bacterium]|nr:DNA polymerase I [Oscillospiraceae bacterium]